MDLLDAGPVALAAAIRRGEVSSEEAVRACLARIDQHDRALRAFVEVRGDAALKDARAHDKARAKGGALPPFHGVPIGIKDLNFARGTRTRFGSRALPPIWSPFDDR